MIRILFNMFYLLLAVQHLPTLHAQYLSIGFLLDLLKFVNERCPFRGIALDHMDFENKLIGKF